MHAHVVSAMNWNITLSYHSTGFYYLNNVKLGVLTEVRLKCSV
jgi:hypothetical protein